MTFIDDEDVIALLLQFKHHDDLAFVIAHELNCDRTWRQFRKDIATECEVLLRLHCADAIRPPFGLNGDDELLAGVADANIQLVRLDLSDIGHGGPQMTLQRIGHHAEKQVDQADIAISLGPSDVADSDETSR